MWATKLEVAHIYLRFVIRDSSSPDFGGFNISEGVTHLKPR